MSQNTQKIKTRFDGVYQRDIKNKLFKNKADVAYEVVYRNGRLKWKTVGYKSEGMTPLLASYKRADLMREVNKQTEEVITLGMAWNKLWADKVQFNKSAISSLIRWKKHIAHLENTKLADISKNDLQGILSDKIKAGYSPKTIRYIFMIIKQIFNHAARQGMFNGVCPAIGIVLPTVDNKRYRYLTKDEARQLMDSLRMRSVATYEIAMVSLHTGLRAGEIFALTGDKINMAEKLIIVTDTKSGKNRIVPVSKHLDDIFKNKELIPGEPVFKGQTGKRIEEVSNTYSRAVDALGLNEGITDPRGKVVFHTLRHTFASWLVIEGITIHVVADLLGHSSLEMTRRYAHLSPAVRKASVAVIEKLWDTSF